MTKKLLSPTTYLEFQNIVSSGFTVFTEFLEYKQLAVCVEFLALISFQWSLE